MIVWSECCWQRRDWRSRSVLIADDGWIGSLTIIGCSGTKCLELAQTLHAWTGFTTWSIIVNLNFQHFRLKTATLPPDHGTASLVEVTLRLVSLAVSSTDWSIDWAAPAAAAALGHLLLELSGLAGTLGTQLTWWQQQLFSLQSTLGWWHNNFCNNKSVEDFIWIMYF